MLSLLLAVSGSACVAPVPVDKAYVSSVFGLRLCPFTEETMFHRGLDLAAPMETRVTSVVSGAVLQAEVDETGHKKVVLLGRTAPDQELILVYYLHLQSFYVGEGQRVRPGDLIGAVGETGRATGPHLHLATARYNAEKNTISYVDPYSQLNLCAYPERKNRYFGGGTRPSPARSSKPSHRKRGPQPR